MKVSEYIHQITPLTLEEKTKVETAFSGATLQKGDFFAQEGKVCRQLGFILSGRVRNYYHDENAVEKTCFFATADTFITAYTSFITLAPSFENIEAIEESRLRVISRPALEALSESIPKIHVFRRIMSENMYILMEKRIHSLQSATALERYEQMIKENPDVLLNVPLQYTASFLGITPQHLSRLRKKNNPMTS